MATSKPRPRSYLMSTRTAERPYRCRLFTLVGCTDREVVCAQILRLWGATTRLARLRTASCELVAAPSRLEDCSS
jgi:uncharacterized protein YfaQ (DUF2300 family)